MPVKFKVLCVADCYSVMSTDPVAVTAWSSGSNGNWKHIKKGFQNVAPQFSNVIEVANMQVMTVACVNVLHCV
jgi:hypothetical protein